MPRRSPPGRETSADVARFHQALRSRKTGGAPVGPRDRARPVQYDESGFPIRQSGGPNFAERVRRLLFTG